MIRVGCFIGIHYVGAPICTDSVLLLTSSLEDLQYLTSIAHQFSQQGRFTIHPENTRVIICDYKGSTLQVIHQWSLASTLLKHSTSLSHLRINRYTCISATTNVLNDRMKCARYTTYSLMGADFHGTLGVGNLCLNKMLDDCLMPSDDNQNAIISTIAHLWPHVVISNKPGLAMFSHVLFYLVGIVFISCLSDYI